MADLWMDVDAALAEVPVNIMPLVDDDDFVTVKTGLAYDAAGMDLRWNFVTTAGAMTSTAVTPTTGGAHDWADQGDGMYSIKIPATSGTINNDTEGFGWFTGVITDVAPFRGPVIGFRSAALNNSLVDGTDNLQVDVIQWEGVDASDTSAGWEAEAGPTEADIWSYATRTVDLSGVTDVLGTPAGADLATDIADLPTAAENAAALLAATVTVGAPADGSAPNVGQALSLIMGAMGVFKLTRSSTTLTAYANDETTVLATWTLDSATAPTTRTRAS